MRTLLELAQFYDEKLFPGILVLEEKRKEVATLVYAYSFIIFLIGALVFFFSLKIPGSDSGIHGHYVDFRIPGTIIAATFSGMYFVYRLLTRSYVSDFKDVVIKQIVNFMDDSLVYQKDGFIRESEFKSSEIFNHSINEYKGDDLIQGTIGKTKIKFSELCAKYVTQGKNRSERIIFKGLFFIADFNKDFCKKTFVLPDRVESMLGGLGTIFQKMNISRPPLVKLEDPEFEKLFSVYSDDPIESRYILSTSLMQRIVSFKKKSKREIYLSFIRSNVYIAIWYKRNLFEPKVFTTMLDFAPIQEYFEDLELAIKIVDDLNLNTRIWSKQ
ncbi:MAG: DUF3137 domain-containing protein [Candidatus Omnitrophica bacterium]|nr:DUF3137 domain-containing protein [Candidatus Omnitrophota bacterium]